MYALLILFLLTVVGFAWFWHNQAPPLPVGRRRLRATSKVPMGPYRPFNRPPPRRVAIPSMTPNRAASPSVLPNQSVP